MPAQLTPQQQQALAALGLTTPGAHMNKLNQELTQALHTLGSGSSGTAAAPADKLVPPSSGGSDAAKDAGGSAKKKASFSAAAKVASRLSQGTASSMAKQREKMELAAANRQAAEDGMIKMDPEELSMMKSELARLQSLIVKLQGADVENAQLKRMLETLRADAKQSETDYENLRAEVKVLNQIIERLQGVEADNQRMAAEAERLRAELLSANSRFEALKAAVLAAEDRMRKDAEEHQRQLADAMAQLDRQKREAAAAHQRCQEEKQALQTQLTSACGVRDKLKQQLEATGEKVGETAAVLEQAEQANLDLQQKLAAATASRDALLQQTEKQRLQAADTGGQLEKSQEQVNLLQKQSKALQQELDAAKGARDANHEQLLALQKQLVEVQGRCEAMELVIVDLRQQLAAKTASSDRWQQECKAAQQQLARELDQRQHFQGEAAALRQQLASVNSALTSSQEDAQSFQQQLQTQSAGATAAKQQSQQLRQQLADALAEKEGLKQQVAHLQEQTLRLQDQLETATHDDEDFKAEIGALQQKLVDGASMLRRAEQDSQALRQQLAELTIQRNKAHQDARVLQQQLATESSLRQNAIEDYRAMQSQLVALSGDLDASQQKQRALQQQLAAEQIRRGETEAACAAQQGSADRAKKQLQELQQSEQALQQHVAEEMAGLRQVQRELADSRQTLKDYEAAHDRYKAEAERIVKDLHTQLDRLLADQTQTDDRAKAQMAELEETFVQQLQKVTDTYKREVSEQQARQAEIEDQLAAAQGELAAAQAQAEVSQKALENLKSHPPPVDSCQQTDDRALELEAQLDTQRQQSRALKLRIMELQDHLQRATEVSRALEGRLRAEGRGEMQAHIAALEAERGELRADLQAMAAHMADWSPSALEEILAAAANGAFAKGKRKKKGAARLAGKENSQEEVAAHVWRAPGVVQELPDGARKPIMEPPSKGLAKVHKREQQVRRQRELQQALGRQADLLAQHKRLVEKHLHRGQGAHPQVLERTQTQRPAAPAPEGPSAALQMWPTTLSISRRSSLQLPHGVSALSEPADRPLLLPSAAAMQAWDRMEAAEPPREPQQQQAAGWLQPDRIQPQQRDHGRLAAAAAEDGAVKQGDAASDGSGVEGEGAEGAAQGQQRWAQRRQAVGSGVGRAPDSTAGPEGDGEAPEVVRQIAAHYEGSEGLARPATAAPSDRQRALRSEGSSLLALRPGTAGLVLNREGADGGLQAGLDGQLGAAGGPAVPEQVRQLADHFEGSEGLARPASAAPSPLRADPLCRSVTAPARTTSAQPMQQAAWGWHQHASLAEEQQAPAEPNSLARSTEAAVWRCLLKAGLVVDDEAAVQQQQQGEPPRRRVITTQIPAYQAAALRQNAGDDTRDHSFPGQRNVGQT
eukprot:jgi/Astpho2/4365/fgenesh1_pg.00066_%23_10_t